jgi:hypothetical protein
MRVAPAVLAATIGAAALEMRHALAADTAKWAKLVHDRHITFDQQ